MKRNFVLLFAVVCLFIFNTSCGLEVLYVIDSPYQSGGTPDQYSSFEDRHFEFRTNETNELEGLLIIGTDVYYKIYDNVDRLNSDVSYINNTDNNTTAKDKLVTGKNYQPLKVNGSDEAVLIKYAEKNRTVTIRLTDYQNSEAFAAKILIDGSYINGSAANSIPVRGISDRSSFNFGRTNIKKPVSTDNDSYITSSSSKGVYYVAAFAVSVGHDASYINYFSNPAYLGYVKIDSSTTDN